MEPSNYIDFKKAASGSIVRLDGADCLKDLDLPVTESSDGLPKPAFYQGKAWEGVSGESEQTKGEHLIIDQCGEDMKSNLEKITIRCKNLSDYYIVDISKALLEKYIPILAKLFPNIRIIGLWGTFDEARRRLKEGLEKIPWENICLLSLGSTLSNFLIKTVIETVGDWAFVAGKVILGQDGNTNKSEVKNSYSTEVVKDFVRGGIYEVNRRSREPVIILDDWDIECEIKDDPIRVVISITAKRNTTKFEKGKKIILFTSYKHPKEEFASSFAAAGYEVITYSAPGTKSNIFAITPPNKRLAIH
ncbi:hypothetical protein GGI35DRAFT_488238 [Trichoderma velutinum]